MIANLSSPLLYLITDRLILPRGKNESELTTLIDFINRAFNAGVDMVQIRERDLCARDLLQVADRLVPTARERGGHLLINDRADIAACAGAGVHLTTRSMKAEAVRKAFGVEMPIGASTHSLNEAIAAEREGADFVVFGPVFETESKKIYGPPVGLEALCAVVARLRIPVLALGGISLSNFRLPLEAGAAGIAGISVFAKADDLASVVGEMKGDKGP